MSKSNKTVLSLLFFVVFILLFIMLYKSPFRLDDLAWGGRIGIERLQNHFENYNGRFMGNITVIVLTRLPAILRVLVEMFILFLLVYCAYRIMDRTIISTSVFCILFFTMPITILTQTVTWVSGFSNYIFSTLLTTAVLLIDLEILKKNEKKRWFFNLLLVLLVFVGQLYIETATLYIVVLSVGMIILYGVFYRKFSMTFILQFISSVVGAILMFSNEHYRSAFLNNGETYKSVNIGGSLIELIKTILITFQDSIAQKWFGMNLFLNLVFAAILVVFCIRSERNRIGRIFGGIGLLYVSFFIYDLMDGDNTILHSNIATVFISGSFVLYILVIIFCLVQGKDERVKLLVLMAAQFVLMAPLNVVSPVHDRCFLNNYVIWALTAGEFLRLTLKENIFSDISFQKGTTTITSVLLIGVLLNSLWGQSLSWKIEALRMAAVERCKETNAEELVIPRVPYSGLYCYGANLNGRYWLGNYKDYYGIDSSVNLVFVDYKDYIAE